MTQQRRPNLPAEVPILPCVCARSKSALDYFWAPSTASPCQLLPHNQTHVTLSKLMKHSIKNWVITENFLKKRTTEVFILYLLFHSAISEVMPKQMRHKIETCIHLKDDIYSFSAWNGTNFPHCCDNIVLDATENALQATKHCSVLHVNSF